MFLIVGLGNPGDQYRNTRHNVGFDILDLLAKKNNIKVNRTKFKGVYGEGTIKGEKVFLLKPQTYMNLSGESIRELTSFYKIANDRIIVIYDDVSLDVGKLRIRTKGSAGGHNGVKNIIMHLSSDVFPRIKIGVGQPNFDLIEFVLSKFCIEDRDKIEKTFVEAMKAVEAIIEYDVEIAMNKFNGFMA